MSLPGIPVVATEVSVGILPYGFIWCLAMHIGAHKSAKEIILVTVPLCIGGYPGVLAMSTHNRCEVKWRGIEPEIQGAVNVPLDTPANVPTLAVERESEVEIVGSLGKAARSGSEYRWHMHAWNLNKTERRGYPPALDESPYAETYNVGGNPPTLDSPLLRDDHIYYTTAEDLMGGLHQSQELLANFSQVVSREIPLVPKESMVSRIVGMPFIPKGCELDSAHVICDLEKVVVAWQGLSIDGSTLGKTGTYRSMHRVGNYPLSVVVVHLYPVIPLKKGKVLLKESDEILFDRLSKGVYAGMFALPIAQREVAEGHLLNQDVESNQIAFARFNVEVFVLLVSAKDRGEMECLFWKAGAVQRPLVSADAFGDIHRLIVEYEGDQIVLGAVADVSRFINEDRKFSHQAAPSEIKMPRDTPRLRDSPPCVESHFSYTTSRSAESIVCEPEHKFVTIDASICSTYRRAA